MKVTVSQVTKINIEGAKALDPIDVFLEDFGHGKGSVTLKCYGQSWSGYWGATGCETVAEFFCSCDEHYLAGKMGGPDSTKPNYKMLPQFARESIIRRRRGRDRIYDSLMKEDARELYDMVSSILYVDDAPNHSVMTEIFGPEWWHVIPDMPNPDYDYLCRIINAAKEGLRSLKAPEQKDAA